MPASILSQYLSFIVVGCCCKVTSIQNEVSEDSSPRPLLIACVIGECLHSSLPVHEFHLDFLILPTLRQQRRDPQLSGVNRVAHRSAIGWRRSASCIVDRDFLCMKVHDTSISVMRTARSLCPIRDTRAHAHDSDCELPRDAKTLRESISRAIARDQKTPALDL